MKKFSILMVMFCTFFACEKKSEIEAEIGSFIWAPNMGVGLNDQSATLYLSDSRPYTENVSSRPENPDYFEVLISEDLENFELHKRLDSFPDSLNIENLIDGNDCYFRVSAQRKGFETVYSNVVSMIPSVKPKVETYPLGIDFSSERMTFSKNFKFMTFYTDSGFGRYNSQDLLFRGLVGGDVFWATFPAPQIGAVSQMIWYI